jgi:cell division control protein 6
VATFIEDCVKSQKGGCLYISGPPGTGKSAMVNEVCQDMDLSDVKVSHVNCVSMRNARDVYSKLIQDFDEDSDVFKKSEGDRLKAMFVPNKPNGLFLVSLDEMDHLLMGDSGVLQSLFEWSLSNKSTLILIGIANALDLTDRSLPQLKAKNLRPILLPFLPYNAASIANVITNRLRSLIPAGMDNDPKFVPFLQPAAIQLCAKKVASQTGDLRKAFELIKRAIDTIEQETQQKLEKQAAEAENNSILAENANLSSPAKAAPATRPITMSSYTAITAPRASIAHIARITTSAFGQGTVQRLKGLNLQQKAAICALIALERKRRELDILSTPSKSRCSAPTVKQAFDTYTTLCRNDNILHPLTSTEFKDVLSNLETMGLVGEYQGRGRGGTVAGGSDIRRTPSKSGNVISTPHKAMDEQGLLCFVSQSEIEGQITGPGEGILRRLLRGEGL